jgi:hypothetical protein
MILVGDVAEGLKVNKLVVSTFPDQTKIDAAIGALRKIHSDRNIKRCRRRHNRFQGFD